MKTWINGKLVQARNAKISVADRGFLYGDGLFETMRCYNGRVFKLDEHLARLFDSGKILKIKISYSKENLKKTVCKILAANSLKDASIRITITRGEGAFALSNKDLKLIPNVVITAKRFSGYPVERYLRGISVRISDIAQDESLALSKAKTLNFLNHIMARLAAQEKGFDDAILMNRKGFVAEAATSNVFLVKKGIIATPSLDSGILAGITRGVVIKITKGFGLIVSQKKISRKELTNADEVFITSSLAELMPVVKVDNFKIGSGKPGPIVKLLHAAYREMV
jgi:branched-chain amino acid aminotransferase